MYFDEPTDTSPIPGARDARLVLTINGVLIAGLGLFPDFLMLMCARSMYYSL